MIPRLFTPGNGPNGLFRHGADPVLKPPGPMYARVSRPAPATGRIELGDHGTATARFDRAIQTGSLFLAELTARELGPLRLDQALELVALAAVKDPARGQRLAARWLERWLAETALVTAADTALAAAALAALGGWRHDVAHAALRGLLRPLAS